MSTFGGPISHIIVTYIFFKVIPTCWFLEAKCSESLQYYIGNKSFFDQETQDTIIVIRCLSSIILCFKWRLFGLIMIPIE